MEYDGMPCKMQAPGVVPPCSTPIQSAPNWTGSHYMAPNRVDGILCTSTTGRTLTQLYDKRVTWADEVSVQQGLRGPLKREAGESPLCTVRERTEDASDEDA